ncbi:MAG: cytochrome P450 [Ekhidna sp.]|nr:cytochrome P450 [Ekhidna sp.]
MEAAINILSPDFDKNPYPLYKQLQEEHPLYFFEPANAYVLSRYEDIHQALTDPAYTVKNYEFQSEPLHGRTFIQMDGREHSQYRNLVAPSIRGRDLAEKLMPIIDETAKEIYAPFLSKTSADFTTEFAARFPVLVISGILGLDKESESNFLKWYRTFVDFIGDLGQTPEITAAAFKTKDEITDYLLPIIADKRENPGDDILSTLCHAEVDGVRMTDQEIKAFVSLLITAGGESTDKMLSHTLRNLLEHPDQMMDVRNDRSLIQNAFVESMRFSPVTHRLMRITSEEVQVSGGTIPANSQVILLLGAAQHDSSVFKDPESFNIHRKELDIGKAFTAAANHVAFGAGRHFCVGSMLAKAEMDVAFNQLFDFTESISLDENAELVEKGLFTRGLYALPIRYTLK